LSIEAVTIQVSQHTARTTNIFDENIMPYKQRIGRAAIRMVSYDRDITSIFHNNDDSPKSIYVPWYCSDSSEIALKKIAPRRSKNKTKNVRRTAIKRREVEHKGKRKQKNNNNNVQ
jgi:hypothetical protein